MKQFITFIFVGTLILLGVLVSRNVSDTPTSTLSSSPSPIAQGGGAPTGTLFATQFNRTGTIIQKIDILTKERVTVFSDRDKTSHIQKLSSVSRDGQTILAVMNDETQQNNTLVSIAMDGSNTQTTLVKDFPQIDSLVLSPDNKTIAYTAYSEDSAKPGVQLNTMSVTGSDKKTLLTVPTTIQFPIFSSDSQSIAYIRGKDGEGYEVVRRTLATGAEAILYTSVQRITQFDWSSIGLMLVGTGAEESSDLRLLDPRSNTTQPVTAENVVAGSARIAPDASGIAYQTPTDLIVIDANNQQQIQYDGITKSLGWTR
jgi:Tol biopolymer transport system component